MFKIIEYCFVCYGKEVEINVQEFDIRKWEFEESKVCVYYVKQLFCFVLKWRLEDFLNVWKRNIFIGL